MSGGCGRVPRLAADCLSGLLKGRSSSCDIFLEFQSIHQGKERYLYYAGQSEALVYRVLNGSRQNMIKSRQIRAMKLSNEDSSALSVRPAGRVNLHLLSDSSVNSAVFRRWANFIASFGTTWKVGLW